MKRIIAFFVAVVLAAFMFIGVSAANVAKFNLRIVSETDTQAVISLDFEGGAGFSGIDIDVIPNDKKVKILSIESGAGLDAFSAQERTGFYEVNKDKTPAKIAMISSKPFRLVDEEKGLFVITLKKLSKEKLSTADFGIVITNCVDSSYQNITPSITTDLQVEVTTTTTVAVSDPTSGDVSQSTTTETSSVTDEQTLTNAVEPDTEALDMEGASAEDTKGDDKDNSKTIIIIIAVVAVVGVIAAAVAVVIKKKKLNSDEQ